MPVVKTPKSKEVIRKIVKQGGAYYVNVKGQIDETTSHVRVTAKVAKNKNKLILLQPL